MDYSSISSSITSGKSTLSGDITGISANNFNGIWSGNAHDNLTGKLTSAMSNLKTQLGLLSTFAGALSELEEYKAAKEKVSSNEATIAKLDPKKDSGTIASLQSENETLRTKMESLRSSIESTCSSITPFSTQDSVIG